MSAPLALVTGASQGIGEAIAHALAQAGFRLALVARRDDALARVEADIVRAGGEAARFACDLSDAHAATQLIDAVRARVGPATVLVNNAGAGGPYASLAALTTEQVHALIALNLTAPLLLARATLADLADSGAGRLINIASVFALRSAPGSAVYTSVKHGLLGLTRAVAVEWGARGVTANAVCPGYIETAMLNNLAQADPARHARLTATVPARRLGSPAEVARLVAFLASADAGYINGAVITLDGGLSAALAT